MANGNDKSLESWIWDAACSIRGAKDAPKFKDYILPLIFTKRLCDVFDDELNRIAKEVGSRANTDAKDPLGLTPPKVFRQLPRSSGRQSRCPAALRLFCDDFLVLPRIHVVDSLDGGANGGVALVVFDVDQAQQPISGLW